MAHLLSAYFSDRGEASLSWDLDHPMSQSWGINRYAFQKTPYYGSLWRNVDWTMGALGGRPMFRWMSTMRVQ